MTAAAIRAAVALGDFQTVVQLLTHPPLIAPPTFQELVQLAQWLYTIPHRVIQQSNPYLAALAALPPDVLLNPSIDRERLTFGTATLPQLVARYPETDRGLIAHVVAATVVQFTPDYPALFNNVARFSSYTYDEMLWYAINWGDGIGTTPDWVSILTFLVQAQKPDAATALVIGLSQLATPPPDLPNYAPYAVMALVTTPTARAVANLDALDQAGIVDDTLHDPRVLNEARRYGNDVVVDYLEDL